MGCRETNMEAVKAGQRLMFTNDKGLRTPTWGEVHPTHRLSLGVRPPKGVPHTEPSLRPSPDLGAQSSLPYSMLKGEHKNN